MAPARRPYVGASRRKRWDEDGEDEGSMVGDVEDDSLSEGSIDSRPDDEDADGEGTEGSEDEATTSAGVDKANGSQMNGDELGHQPARHSSTSPRKLGLKPAMSETEAMLNGLKVPDERAEATEVHFDDMKEDRELQSGRTSAPPTEPRREISAAKKRRDNEKYFKEREQNPANVPTRGSFFLHDKRTTEVGSHAYRPFNKAKSRPYGLIVDGNARRYPPRPDASEGQWAHDLHDMVVGDEPPAPKHSSSSTLPNPALPVPTAPRSSPPNRSFCSTTLVGNVSIIVFLPGMAQPTSFPAVPKKQHTRLPQHRPPLRRDKPVRISLPGQAPRYIFPSIERSFIFIPRALRPNQQGYRGRGRGGGFYGGRRPSYYANTTYTPSVLSRRSSLAQEGYPSPAASVYSQPGMAPVPSEPGKPVVRLPPPSRPPVGVAAAPAGPAAPMPPMQFPPPPYRESRPAPIPMHQPRPQKAVSVADIESPASFPFNPPQPPPELPLRHQFPVPVNGPALEPTHGPPSHVSGTPLSHIPERAIHAQPFQPYGYQQPFYPPGYPPGGTVYYPPSGPEYPTYNGPLGPGMPTFVPGQQPMPYAVPTSSSEQQSQPGAVAHESGGTVYFYDASHMYPSPALGMPGSGPGGVVGMGGMMTPPGTTYYYPQPPGGGGMYYGHQ